MTFAAILIGLLVSLIIFLVSAIPLHLAVKTLGGKTSLLKTAIVAFLAGLAVAIIEAIFNIWGGAIAFIIMIWIYHEMFKLKWIKAFLAWLLQFIFLAIFYMLAILLLGVGTLALLL